MGYNSTLQNICRSCMKSDRRHVNSGTGIECTLQDTPLMRDPGTSGEHHASVDVALLANELWRLHESFGSISFQTSAFRNTRSFDINSLSTDVLTVTGDLRDQYLAEEDPKRMAARIVAVQTSTQFGFAIRSLLQSGRRGHLGIWR